MRLRQALDRAIAQIHQLSSYEDFLASTKWDDITRAMVSVQSLVYLFITSAGSLTLASFELALISSFSTAPVGDSIVFSYPRTDEIDIVRIVSKEKAHRRTPNLMSLIGNLTTLYPSVCYLGRNRAMGEFLIR